MFDKDTLNEILDESKNCLPGTTFKVRNYGWQGNHDPSPIGWSVKVTNGDVEIFPWYGSMC